ncbi:MAG: hypothetical protein ACLPXB_05920 [Thiobacillaceae bacterium]
MNKVAIQPMQWKPIIDISETEGFTEVDAACFAEVRDVLSKYGLLDKYGMSLVHRHFDILDDECLVERVDADTRTLSVRPVKQAELQPNATTVTMWRFTQGEKVAEVSCQCYVSARGHEGRHGVY